MILTSCQLYSCNVSYNTSLLLEQVRRGNNQAPEKYSAVNIEIGICRNTKCAIWNGFPKSSHTLGSEGLCGELSFGGMSNGLSSKVPESIV